MPHTNNDTGSTLLDDLIDDVLLLIFRNLSLIDRIRIERVSQRWQRLNRSSWKNVHSLNLCKYFENDNEFCDIRDCNKVLVAFLRRAGPYLQSLDLSESFCSSIHLDFTEKSYRAIGRHSPLITNINLSYQSLSNSKLVILGEIGSQIESLTLVRCFDDEENPEDGLIQTFSSMKQLKYVDLSRNDNLTGQCFSRLSINLEHLLINQCSGVKPECLQAVAENCPNLKHFEFSGCAIDLCAFLVKVHKLKNLKLAYYEAAPIQEGLAGLTDLRILDISHSSQIDNKLIETIGQYCTLLEILNISGKAGTKANVTIIPLNSLIYLRELDISWLERLTDRQLYAVTKNSCFEVVHAHMCDGITCDGFFTAIKLCPKLRLLDLTGCASIGLNFLIRASKITAEVRRSTVEPLIVEIGNVAGINKIHKFVHSKFQVSVFKS